MKEIECEGKTVTIAVETGLKEIGLRRDQVEVQVLDEGSAGILGFGMKPARVLIREKRWGEAPAPAPETPPAPAKPRARLSSARPTKAARPARPAAPATRPAAPKSSEAGRPRTASGGGTSAPEGAGALPRENARSAAPRPEPRPAPRPEPRPAPAPVARREERPATPPRPRREPPRTPRTAEEAAAAAEAAQAVLTGILELAKVAEPKVTARWDADQDRVQAEIATPDGGLVIGKGGRTLEALQFLTTIIVGRRTGAPCAVQVECEGWWKRVEERLAQEADRAAGEVAQTGKPFRFEPMDAAMRRLVHRRLADHPDVETSSEGEGAWRRVVVRLKKV